MRWQLASSHAAVCAYCRFALIRSDRELTAIGRVADLVPTAPPLAVGDTGSAAGRSFRVLGRLQLDHGRGPWDEWYLALADGQAEWAWLARAQGRWYLTFARDAFGAPTWTDLSPGDRVELPGTGSVAWVVTERGGSAVLSAEGELPFAIDPRGSGRYADLEGEGGAFATLDYGDGSAPVQLFAGRELAPDELSFKPSALGPRPSERVEVERLACPSCGAPIAIFVPSETERCGCQACGALLDHARGALRLLQQLEPPAIVPQLALGSEGELLGTSRLVIGFMQRAVFVAGERYTFREYLLHSARGYSWLVEEDWHWLHVAPVQASAVKEQHESARYQGRSYRRFARGTPVVELVMGEFYWKVQQGDRAETVDFIAPPRLLSMERTENELSWSEGEYVEPEALERAFGLREALPRPIGVAPAQPNPYRAGSAARMFGLLALAWFALLFMYECAPRKTVVCDVRLEPPAEQNSTSLFIPQFEVKGGPTTLHVAIESDIHEGYVTLEAALVPELGEPQALTLVSEHYAGVSDGEAWEEDSRQGDGYFGGVTDGRYSLRLLATWGADPSGWGANPRAPLHVRVKQHDRSHACALVTFVLLALPWLIALLRRRTFEARRRENENPW